MPLGDNDIGWRIGIVGENTVFLLECIKSDKVVDEEDVIGFHGLEVLSAAMPCSVEDPKIGWV